MNLDRPAKVCGSSFQVAGLKGEHAEQMNGVGMIGVDIDNLQIQTLGFDEPSGAMVSESLVDEGLCVNGGSWSTGHE